MTTKEGFKFGFDPNGCENCNGNCCIGESGYIWISDEEITAVSQHFCMTEKEFKNRFLDKYNQKYTIREKRVHDGNYACIFFDLNNKKCLIYDFRPVQCRTFPFWDYFKENYEEVLKECPAVLPF